VLVRLVQIGVGQRLAKMGHASPGRAVLIGVFAVGMLALNLLYLIAGTSTTSGVLGYFRDIQHEKCLIGAGLTGWGSRKHHVAW